MKGRAKIGVRVGRVIGKYKVGKHFDLAIENASFTFSINAERVAAEAALDGPYVIRTSVAESDMSAQAAVLNYKRLAEIEKGFRTLKGVDLSVRPIRHRLEGRVRAHILISKLAYYVQCFSQDGCGRREPSPAVKNKGWFREWVIFVQRGNLCISTS